MERWSIGLSSLVFFAALGAGCGTPCDDAQGRIESRYEDCGIQVAMPPDSPENVTCSTADADYQKCVADCTESATCEALNGKDAQAGADFGECYADCAN